MNKFTITIPASSANIGPGFDSAGLAVNKYLTLSVEYSDDWEFEHQSVHLPATSDPAKHLIYQTAKKTADTYHAPLHPCKVVVESEIPLARGLGSSASAIVAGIELANQLCQLNLTDQEKLKQATILEGHPDNVAASLLGGLVIASPISSGEIEVFKKADPQVELVVAIPEFELKTDDARKVLPDQFSRDEAAAASAVGNIVFAALVSGNYELAGKMMEEDLFHEPYRASLIPNYREIRNEAKLAGAYATVISGAGPTTISLVPKGKGSLVSACLQKNFPSYNVESLKIDPYGLRVNLDISSRLAR